MYSAFLENKRRTSELIDIGKFIENHNGTNLIETKPYENAAGNRKSDILKLMNVNIDMDYLENLSKYCETDNAESKFANVSSESTNMMKKISKNMYVPEKISPQALQFKSIKKLKERIQKDKKYCFKHYLKCALDSNPINDCVEPGTTFDLIPGREVVIRIRTYQNLDYRNGRAVKHKLSHDIIVLGSHTLDVLRDKIICPNDFGSVSDMSENPNPEETKLIIDRFKSGFLYIEDTFYNDTRHSENIDYSKYIIDWASTKKDYPTFKTATMENTTFNDLKVHLGYPQVYQHNGNCEHVFVFSDIEILQASDVCCSSKYPYYKSLVEKKSKYCNMCGLFVAKWYVTESDRVPFDPAYFCETCFRSYNYIDGNKIGNFKAYPFFN